jgi:hypothetical protein
MNSRCFLLRTYRGLGSPEVAVEAFLHWFCLNADGARKSRKTGDEALSGRRQDLSAHWRRIGRLIVFPGMLGEACDAVAGQMRVGGVSRHYFGSMMPTSKHIAPATYVLLTIQSPFLPLTFWKALFDCGKPLSPHTQFWKPFERPAGSYIPKITPCLKGIPHSIKEQ